MTISKKTELVLDQKFDPRTCRQILNDKTAVFHCHHFSTLYTQLADDCGMLDGKKLLAEVAEDTFFEVLKDYFEKHNLVTPEDRISIVEQYYVAVGLGKLEILCAAKASGEAQLLFSHVDQGWVKKWGTRERPVNFITSGYLAAAFAAIFNKPTRSYAVIETASIVSGAKKSLFNIVVN